MKSQFYLVTIRDAFNSKKVIQSASLDSFKNVAFFRANSEINNARGVKNGPAKVTIQVAHASSQYATILEEFPVLDSRAAQAFLIQLRDDERAKRERA